jgi:hypothetical protein
VTIITAKERKMYYSVQKMGNDSKQKEEAK